MKKKVFLLSLAVCCMVGCGNNQSDNSDKASESTKSTESNEDDYDISISQGATVDISFPNNNDVVNKYYDETQPATRTIQWKGKNYEVDYFETCDSLWRGVEHTYESMEVSVIVDDNDSIVDIVFNCEDEADKEKVRLDNDEYKQMAIEYIGDVDLEGYECEVGPYPYVDGYTSEAFVRKYNEIKVEDYIEVHFNTCGEICSYTCVNFHSFDNITEEAIDESGICSEQVIEQINNQLDENLDAKVLSTKKSEEHVFVNEEGKVVRDVVMKVSVEGEKIDRTIHAIVNAK